MLLNEKTPAIVQQLQQEQDREWQSIVDEVAKIDIQETEGALRMGDLFLEAEERFGGKHLKKLAEDAGVSYSVAAQRHWVSKRITKDSPIRKMRSLSFSHLRAIAGTDNPEYWAQRVEEDQLKVRDLIEEIDKAGLQRAVEQREKCSQCEDELPENGNPVSLTVGRGRRTRCCSPDCAITYLSDLKQETGDADGDPFLEAAPVAAEAVEAAPADLDAAFAEETLEPEDLAEEDEEEDDPWA